MSRTPDSRFKIRITYLLREKSIQFETAQWLYWHQEERNDVKKNRMQKISHDYPFKLWWFFVCYCAGFRYNLGFSGSYFRTGGYYDNQGDDELLAVREPACPLMYGTGTYSLWFFMQGTGTVVISSI